MIIRNYTESDYNKILALHDAHYSNEFLADELFDKAADQFIITDDDDKLIVYGANRLIVEVIAVTDKDRSVRERTRALNLLLQVSTYSSLSAQYKQNHAFVQDPNFLVHLRKFGFKPTKGHALVLNLSK